MANDALACWTGAERLQTAFITRQIKPLNLQSQQDFMECQAGNRGSSLDKKTNMKDVHWECAAWHQRQKLASNKDAIPMSSTNELSLIVHLIVLDPVCIHRKVSGSEATSFARHCLLPRKAHAGAEPAAWLHA